MTTTTRHYTCTDATTLAIQRYRETGKRGEYGTLREYAVSYLRALGQPVTTGVRVDSDGQTWRIVYPGKAADGTRCLLTTTARDVPTLLNVPARLQRCSAGVRCAIALEIARVLECAVGGTAEAQTTAAYTRAMLDLSARAV